MWNKINETFLDRSNLQGEWLLDWNANDSSGNGNNGTASNVTWVWADRGYVEETGSFNGSSSKIDLPNFTVTSFTYSGFFKMNAWWINQTIFTLWNTWSTQFIALRLNTSNQIFISSFNWTTEKTLFTTEAFLVGETYNVTLENNSWTCNIYINWALIKSWTIHNQTYWWTVNAFGYQRASWNIFFFNWEIGMSRLYSRVISQQERDVLYLEGLRKLWPTNLANRSQGLPKYSLPNLESSKVLEISKAQSGWIYYDQTGNWNNGTATNVTDSTVGLNNVMSISSWNITWPSTSFLTALCWEQISWKWVLQGNPSYITSTWISNWTRIISNIVLYNRVLSIEEIYQFRYGNTIV